MELWISLRQKLQTVARLFSHIPASPYRFRPRVKAKARLVEAKTHRLKARGRAEAKTHVTVPAVSPELRAANILSLNPPRVRRGPLVRVCPVRNASLSPRNLQQRKTRCLRADKGAADAHSGRACRRETR